jgi:predicted  nucleic acid-binding Zn-ribbon protein
MNSDLERLIALQKLDSAAHVAERGLSDGPERERALEARIDAARQRVAAAKELLTVNSAARRDIEKEVAVHTGRLSKFRETAMAVKTNVEYHAVQKEIAFAQTEIKTLEDKILELMLEADDLTGQVKRAEADLAAEQKAVDAERKTMNAEAADMKAALERIAGERAAVVSNMSARVLASFEAISKKRNGIGVAEARDGVCTICHVRLRPQVFNNVRLNAEIIQCDHCNRILYFIPAPVAAAAAPDSVPQPQ